MYHFLPFFSFFAFQQKFGAHPRCVFCDTVTADIVIRHPGVYLKVLRLLIVIAAPEHLFADPGQSTVQPRGIP
jgi:hypothetical protein